MKALVTGATGFLGSWLTRELLDQGYRVRALAHEHQPTPLFPETSKKIEFMLGDITDPESVARACQGMEVVFHLAGVVGYSKAQRALMERVNVDGTANVLAALRGSSSVRRLIHVSSVAAIGASFDGKRPLTEDSPYAIGHLNLGYFETKRAGEKLVHEAALRGDVPAVILNPSTIYGAGDMQKGSRGAQAKVAQRRMPFYTSGGVGITAVEDVVQALLAAVEKGRVGERYILCGENITIRQLFRHIAAEANVAPPRIGLPNMVVRALGRIGDGLEAIGKKGPLNSETAWSSILFHWFDHAKARRELSFQPRPARAAIANSVHWYLEHIQ